MDGGISLGPFRFPLGPGSDKLFPMPAWIALSLAAVQGAATETVAVPETPVRVELVRVPGGRVRIGGAELEVRPFWIARHEATWDEFAFYYDHLNHFQSKRRARVDGVTRPSQPHEPPDARQHGWEAARHPAMNLKWHAAMAYCDWLSRKTGQRFRLPTEAEWELAARAGAPEDAPAAPELHAWHRGNSGGRTHPVGTRKPNAWGLHDMLGNVWEQCLEFEGRDEPEPVFRGGGWNTPAGDLRFSARKVAEKEWAERDSTNPKSLWWWSDAPFAGFRVVRPGDPSPRKEREAYAARVRIEKLAVTRPEDPVASFAQASGEVVNAGDRPIAELELLVHFVEGDGKPLLVDPKGRATFIRCYPALANSAKPGPHRQPLKAGERRAFEFFIPHPRDETGPLDFDKIAGEVRSLEFSSP